MPDFFWPSIPLTVFAAVNKTILIWFWFDLIMQRSRRVQADFTATFVTYGRRRS